MEEKKKRTLVEVAQIAMFIGCGWVIGYSHGHDDGVRDVVEGNVVVVELSNGTEVVVKPKQAEKKEQP